MKDAYSFHTSAADLGIWYDQVVAAYQEVFRRVDLPVLIVKSDTGLMGGQVAHEFMLLNEGGEDTLLICPQCGYAANQEVAKAQMTVRGKTELQELQRVHTPGITSITDLAAFLQCEPEEILKAVFYRADNTLVVALIRGDLEVSDTKLAGLLGRTVTSLSANEAESCGLKVGYVGPVDLTVSGEVVLVADDTIVAATNLVAGANSVGYHIRGVNYGRDFVADLVGDIAKVTPGCLCAQCGHTLEAQRGIEVANTFKLGTKYSEAMLANFTDESGTAKPMLMGCYGIGITRLLACIVEHHHDADGIVWPVSVAPYRYHLLLGGKSPESIPVADTLYQQLGESRTLYDDRDLSIGVKLKDADLLGMPIRITISDRSLSAGGAEIRLRHSGMTRVVELAEAATVAQRLAEQLATV